MATLVLCEVVERGARELKAARSGEQELTDPDSPVQQESDVDDACGEPIPCRAGLDRDIAPVMAPPEVGTSAIAAVNHAPCAPETSRRTCAGPQRVRARVSMQYVAPRASTSRSTTQPADARAATWTASPVSRVRSAIWIRSASSKSTARVYDESTARDGQPMRLGGDVKLRRALPPIRSCAEFFLHWLVELPDGSLGTVPSTSPENVFAQPDGRDGSVDASSTMDLVLIADLFWILGAVAERCGLEDDSVVRQAASALPRIPGPEPGRDGMIPEWRADRPQREYEHRHLSHLYFAFPGDLPMTPQLRAAVSKSLDGRGDKATGWSLAWKVALRARLNQPRKVSDLIKQIFRDMEVDPGEGGARPCPTLFATHLPFQIDANLGFVAAFTECLMQSHAGVIELLPAVPPELATGSVAGIVARPGIEVSIRWEPDAAGGITLIEATFSAVRAPGHARHRVAWNGREVWIDLSRSAAITLRRNDFTS